MDVEHSQCGPAAAAQAYVFNATVIPPGSLGYLTLWPDGTDQPLVSTLNAADGSLSNNMAIVPSTNGKVDAFANGLTQLILDISSYFAPWGQLSVVSKTTADPSTPAARRCLRLIT